MKAGGVVPFPAEGILAFRAFKLPIPFPFLAGF
jgi:hypothetical protein